MAAHKQFVYLVQARKHYARSDVLVTPNSDCVILYWQGWPSTNRMPHSDRGSLREILVKDTTWNSGRNRLLREALSMGRYEFYVFLDDDVVLRDAEDTKTNPFRLFESLLIRSAPAVGVANGTWHHVDYRKGNELSSLHFYDACINAFHRDSLKLLLPYCEKFDHTSWWWSQSIVNSISGEFFAGRNIQFNRIIYENPLHDSYPRNEGDVSMDVPVEYVEKSFRGLSNALPRNPLDGMINYPVVERGVKPWERRQLEETVLLDHPYWMHKREFWERTTGVWL